MRALVLSGGGSRGSYEAGVMQYMGELGLLYRCIATEEPPDEKWSAAERDTAATWRFDLGFPLVSGASVGGINGSGVAMYRPEQFPEATRYVAELWTDKVQKTSDIWRLRQPCGIPALWNPSLGTNTALGKLLTELVDIDKIKASGITMRLPAVDLESGDVRNFGVEDLDRYGIAPIMASASFPVAFPPVPVADWWLTDGGVVDIAPIGAAIDAGATEIVVILTRSDKGIAYKSRKQMGNAIAVAMRIIDIMTQTVLMGDLAAAELYNTLLEHCPDHPKVRSKRHVKITTISPTKPLGDPLNFKGETMRAQMAQGYEDARDQLGG